MRRSDLVGDAGQLLFVESLGNLDQVARGPFQNPRIQHTDRRHSEHITQRVYSLNTSNILCCGTMFSSLEGLVRHGTER